MSTRMFESREGPLYDIVRLLVTTYEEWRSHRTIRLGAGLAYYGLFSFTSVLAVALAMFRLVGRRDAFEDALSERLVHAFGSGASDSGRQLFDQIDRSTGAQLGLIGAGSLLVTGSLFFVALEDALNQIWDVPVQPGLRRSVQRRLTSLVVLLGAAATVVVSFGVQAATSLLEAVVPGSVPAASIVGPLVTSLAGWSVLAAALVLLLRYVPTVEVPWRPTIVASVITSLLLVVGTTLIGWYLRTIGASSLGGVVATPLVLLVWIYYEAQILLAGAHFGKVLSDGSSPVVTPPA